jgi:methyltransferase (TIGR00027 family)
MRQSQASSTARGTAAARALETEKPADVRICNDPLARRLTDPLFYYLIKIFANYGERRTHGALTFIVCRQRYIDDYLRKCLSKTTSQVVILGAGLDSRAYRDTATAVRFFEIDHPATQAGKIRKLKGIIGKIPPNITFVPVDFESETLDKLLTFGFNRTAKTVFIWEGVTPYLTLQGIDATLAWISTNAASGSSIVFDYKHSSSSKPSFLGSLMSRISGEARTFEIQKESIDRFLKDRGFYNIVNIGSEKLRNMYCVGQNCNRNIPEEYSIVYAEIGKGAA